MGTLSEYCTEGQEELITQLWQKAICKLYEIQYSIRNKYVSKKKEKLLDFSFLQKIKTHYQILEKIKKRSLVKL